MASKNHVLTSFLLLSKLLCDLYFKFNAKVSNNDFKILNLGEKFVIVKRKRIHVDRINDRRRDPGHLSGDCDSKIHFDNRKI